MQPLQRSLFSGDVVGVDDSVAVERRQLDDRSWLDVGRGWLAGADDLFDDLVRAVPWTQGRRPMYDRVVDDPRLSRWYGSGQALPHPVLDDVRAALRRRYEVPFAAVGLNLYRDGHDSVAFHRDRELRDLDADTLVAVLTLGSARPFLVRPRGGGRSVDLRPGSGDLVVMGGRCQADWEHGVPKAASCGPRLSVSLRWKPAGAPAGRRRAGRAAHRR